MYKEDLRSELLDLRSELLFDKLTGLKNERAWRERIQDFNAAVDSTQVPQKMQGWLELDCFYKRLYKESGYDLEEVFIKSIAESIQFAGIEEVYRIHEDFFIVLGNDDLILKIEYARNLFAKKTFIFTLNNGKIIKASGIGFSYGTAINTQNFEGSSREAEARLMLDKLNRKEAGFR